MTTDKEQISKFLTEEVLEKCWHEWGLIRDGMVWKCGKCKEEGGWVDAPENRHLDNPEGIFTLMKVAKEKDWWGEFEYTMLFNPNPDEAFYLNYGNLFNLPDVMYKFLKARGKRGGNHEG